MFDEDDDAGDTHSPVASKYRDWIPDDAMKALMEERETLHPQETDLESTTRIFAEASPMAALAITHLALYGKTDAVRLRAAQTVMDRAMGRVAEPATGREETPVDKMFAKMDQHLAEAASTNE